VIREYVGSSEFAGLAALLDAEEREERETKRLGLKNQKSEATKSVSMLAELGIVTDALVCKALQSAGYHKHKGEWRRRRKL
jgi:hypothetical protein